MIYNIKAIPTTYAGVNFRSRLESRWAAFFDLCGWKWDYEPFDLEGWAPDFLIKTAHGDVLVEVKPLDIDNMDANLADTLFAKAFKYWNRYQVLLLGAAPYSRRDLSGIILDTPGGAKHDWLDMLDIFEDVDATNRWRKAGNMVQWKHSHSDRFAA